MNIISDAKGLEYQSAEFIPSLRARTDPLSPSRTEIRLWSMRHRPRVVLSVVLEGTKSVFGSVALRWGCSSMSKSSSALLHVGTEIAENNEVTF